MAARIVYDGVGGGGNLFEGTTFHVHQRVPQRNSILQRIEANGGEIHPLEKGADIIIADCARKDCPPGSVSWKYIDHSVKKGELQNIEDYPASKLPRETNGTAAPSATSPATSRMVQSRRMGRTPFTHEDDKLLMDFCIRKERAGEKLKGNIIFQELEQNNPRHTAQSWRDRWVRHLQDRPRPALEDEDEPAPKLPAPKPKASPKTSRQAPNPAPRSSKVESARPAPKSPVAKSTPQNLKTGLVKATTRVSAATPEHARISSPNQGRSIRPYIEASEGGTEFTNDETELLVDHYESIMNIDEDQMIDAWIAWSVAYPNHTPQEWRNHFNKEVKGKMPPPERSKRKPTPLSSPVSSPRSTRSRDKGKGRATEDNAPSLPTREVKDSQGSSNQTIKSPGNIQISEGLSLTDEELFKANFLNVVDIVYPEHIKEEINFYPDICDVQVSLFEIWKGAYALGGPAELSKHNRWPELAEQLDFLKSQWKRAGKELKVICDDLLAGFEHGLNQFREISDSQADQEIDDQLRNEADEAAHRFHSSENGAAGEDGDDEDDDDLNAPQSSSVVKIGMKRKSPDNITPDNKRQKLDKGKSRARNVSEIPSTPEDILNSHRGKSPLKPSPLKQATLQPEEGLEHDEPSLFMSEQSPSPFKASVKPRSSDPYTQDFHFQDSLPKEAGPVEDENDEDQEEQHIEVSPSPVRTRKLPINNTSQSNPSSTNATRNSGPSQTGTSTQSQTDSQQQESFEEFRDKCLMYGYNLSDIATALKATSITLGPISMLVMQSLKEGNGIPKDQTGVWTAKDDLVLKKWKENADSPRNKMKMLKLVLKHGKDSIKRRKRHLQNTEEEHSS